MVHFPGWLCTGVYAGYAAGNGWYYAVSIFHHVNKLAACDHRLPRWMGDYDNLHPAFVTDNGFLVVNSMTKN